MSKPSKSLDFFMRHEKKFDVAAVMFVAFMFGVYAMAPEDEGGLACKCSCSCVSSRTK